MRLKVSMFTEFAFFSNVEITPFAHLQCSRKMDQGILKRFIHCQVRKNANRKTGNFATPGYQGSFHFCISLILGTCRKSMSTRLRDNHSNNFLLTMCELVDDKSYKCVLTTNVCYIAIKCDWKFDGHFSTAITSVKVGQLRDLFAGFI